MRSCCYLSLKKSQHLNQTWSNCYAQLGYCCSAHRPLFFFSPSTLNLLTPDTSPVFNYICPSPRPTWNTNVGAGAFFISRIFVKLPPCLPPAPSDWLHMSFFWCYEGVKQLGKAATEPSHHPQRPSCLWLGSPAPVTPIKIGSLAVFTKPSSHLIELEQLHGSRSVVRWVFIFCFMFTLNWHSAF